MTRDPATYHKPNKFIPERWLPAEGNKMPLDVRKIIFGVGWRIHPGKYFAVNHVFIGVASILVTFNITKALDGNGVPVTPKAEYIPRFIRHQNLFKYILTSRSDKTKPLIRQAVDSAK